MERLSALLKHDKQYFWLGLSHLAAGKSCKCSTLGYLQGSDPMPAELSQANRTPSTAQGAWQSPQMLTHGPLLARRGNTCVQDAAGYILAKH